MLDVDDKDTHYAFLPALGAMPRGGMTERVQMVLREAIVSGDLPPGADIDKQAICERLGVSRFPVSEALARLQAEGLVEIQPQRGTRVTRIRLGDVRESTFIRRALESHTVRALARRHDEALVEALERNLRYQSAAVAAGDRDGFHALDLEFHQILVDALGFGRVRIAVEQARASLDRVRRLLASPRRHAVTFGEHEQIVSALRIGDSDGAARAMEAHLDAVVTELEGFALAEPAIFDDSP
jgi:DNA-binding GntR family transcriptional regulator